MGVSEKESSRAKGMGIEMVNQATELKLHAERRMGAVLKKKGAKQGQRKSNIPDGDICFLRDNDISLKESARAKKFAATPDKEFEAIVADVKEVKQDKIELAADEAAILWIIANQLNRRNLHPMDRITDAASITPLASVKKRKCLVVLSAYLTRASWSKQATR